MGAVWLVSWAKLRRHWRSRLLGSRPGQLYRTE